MAQPTQKLSVIQRGIARAAIQRAEGWDDYRKRKGINSSMLSGQVLYDAADALGVIVADEISRHNQTAREAHEPKAQPVADGGSFDPQRVRAIAREEIAAKLKPVVVEKQVIIAPQRRIETGDEIKHPRFDDLLAACNVRDFSGNRLNVYLYGPTGTGNTYAAAQIARLLGLEFYFHSTAQEAYDLAGYEKINGELAESDFMRAFELGGVCLLDELDRYDPKALTVINAALANGRLVKPNGDKVTRHDDFICIGAGNTSGLGATADFTAAETLDKSTLSRFAVKLHWDVDPALEEMAAAGRSQNPDVAMLWLAEVRKAREVLERLGLPEAADQRCVEAGANMLAAGMGLELVRDLTYRAGWEDEHKDSIKQLMGPHEIRPHQIKTARKEA